MPGELHRRQLHHVQLRVCSYDMRCLLRQVDPYVTRQVPPVPVVASMKHNIATRIRGSRSCRWSSHILRVTYLPPKPSEFPTDGRISLRSYGARAERHGVTLRCRADGGRHGTCSLIGLEIARTRRRSVSRHDTPGAGSVRTLQLCACALGGSFASQNKTVTFVTFTFSK